MPLRARVRPYASSDRDACLRVFDSNVPHFFRDEERPGFEDFLDDLPGPYFVLVDADGSVLGCGGYALREGSRVADLCWGIVRRERQGEGLGRALTELRVERALEDASVAELALETSQHTVGFYERMGFRTLSAEPDAFAPGLDRVRMVRNVPRSE